MDLPRARLTPSLVPAWHLRLSGPPAIRADGALLPTPAFTVPTIAEQERGLIGITLDPGFSLTKVALANPDPWFPNNDPDQWIVRSGDDTFLLKRKGPPSLPPLRLAITGAPSVLKLETRRFAGIVYAVEASRGYEAVGSPTSPGAFQIEVQPGHYLCMGDNSPESSDGRTWGLVPERLLLGRALLVYWPAWPTNRMGRIR